MMRSTDLLRVGALALLAACAAVQTASARERDRVYADSFGNLVVESAAGYKRIIVGEGRLAKELSRYTGSDQPDVVYSSKPAPVSERDCYRPPVLVKGRSYMYGLSDGEMPQISPCR